MSVQLAIELALDAYAMAGTGDVKLLKGSAYRRLRIRRYRVIFGEDAVTILAIQITKRGSTTYKGGLP